LVIARITVICRDWGDIDDSLEAGCITPLLTSAQCSRRVAFGPSGTYAVTPSPLHFALCPLGFFEVELKGQYGQEYVKDEAKQEWRLALNG